jgi:hypothetical protein
VAEFNRLRLINYSHPGQFIGVLDFLEPEHVHLRGDPQRPTARFWAVVKRMESRDLRTVIINAPNSVHELYSYAHSVVSIVAVLNDAGYAWLDVKPANIVQ